MSCVLPKCPYKKKIPTKKQRTLKANKKYNGHIKKQQNKNMFCLVRPRAFI